MYKLGVEFKVAAYPTIHQGSLCKPKQISNSHRIWTMHGSISKAGAEAKTLHLIGFKGVRNQYNFFYENLSRKPSLGATNLNSGNNKLPSSYIYFRWNVSAFCHQAFTLSTTPSSHPFVCMFRWCIAFCINKGILMVKHISHASWIKTNKTQGIGWRGSFQCLLIY